MAFVGIEPETLLSCRINLYADATPLSAQIAEWHVHKDLRDTVAAALAFAEPQSGARSPSSSPPVAAALASAEPPGGARSRSSSPPVAAALASAEPPGGARSPSSRPPVAAALASA